MIGMKYVNVVMIAGNVMHLSPLVTQLVSDEERSMVALPVMLI